MFFKRKEIKLTIKSNKIATNKTWVEQKKKKVATDAEED
jgi:hypothetical protein